MKNKFFITLSFFLFFTIFSFAQKNFYVVLEKVNYDQVYTISNSFPTDWIQSKWNDGFNVEVVSFKNNNWFVVLDKYKKKHKQVFLTNPSQQQLDDKSKDGYIIRDICLYTKDNKINRLYALAKISNNPINNFYAVGKADKKNNSSITNSKANLKSLIAKNIKSIKLNNEIQYSYLAFKNDINHNNHYWFLDYRVDFPEDLISNKKEQGFFLNSLFYDHYYKSWCVIMSKKKSVKVSANSSGNIWTWEHPKKREWEYFNYQTEKEKIEDYIKKGYRIININ